VAGGLVGGPLGGPGGGAGWADKAATATNRLALTNRRFMVVFSVEEILAGSVCPDPTIVAPDGRFREPMRRCSWFFSFSGQGLVQRLVNAYGSAW